MNIVNENNIPYNYEHLWRTPDKKYDDSNKLLPAPKEGKIWSGQLSFVTKLNETNLYMIKYDKYTKFQNPTDCLICGKKNIKNYFFKIEDVMWDDGLLHYIEKHNVKPTDKFIDLIYKFQPEQHRSSVLLKSKTKSYNIKNINYIKITRNHILIMDALMKHGGYSKKYVDKINKNIQRYSEHAGILLFNNKGLEHILLSCKTDRIDVDDPTIYMPNLTKLSEYEYIFHTHPPTPYPGSRSKEGIMYEFPSISDIFHFIYNYNNGLIHGSIIITPEGMYNIRKKNLDFRKIEIDEDKLYSAFNRNFSKIQSAAINKYGTNLNTYKFYSAVAQDISFVTSLNIILEDFDIYIDYFPRTKDITGKWIIDDIYLPVYVFG